jgi:glycosyltransferase involved in cell wall biosynthesis
MSIDRPLVTIGVPVYNGERYLRRALDSLISQDYGNIEIAISDNASTDGTPIILKEYTSRHGNIRVYTQSRNLGVHENFKSVLGVAQGKYFMWAGVDDLWLPEFVSSLVQELENKPDVGVAMCAVDRVQEDGSAFDTVSFLNKTDPNKKSRIGMAIGLTSKLKYNLFMYGLFRTDLLREVVRFWPKIKSSDRLLLVQIALAAKFSYINKVLHVRTFHVKPYHERYPLDELGSNRMKAARKRVDSRWIIGLSNSVPRSRIVPLKQKVLLPVLIVTYVYFHSPVRWRKVRKEGLRLLQACYRIVCPQTIQGCVRRIRSG